MTCRAARERQLERYRRSRSALVIFGKDTSVVRVCDQIDDNLLQMYFVGIYRRDEAGRDVQGDTSSLCLSQSRSTASITSLLTLLVARMFTLVWQIFQAGCVVSNSAANPYMAAASVRC